MKNQPASRLHQIQQCGLACSYLLAVVVTLSTPQARAESTPQVRAEITEFSFGDGITAEITKSGAMKEITVAKVPVVTEGSAGGGALSGCPADAKDAESRLHQAWGWLVPAKEKFEATQDKISASGALLPKASLNPELGCDFAIAYRKVRNGVLEISVEVTYTGNGLWEKPVAYYLYFPVAALGDASIKTEGGDASSEDYFVEKQMPSETPAVKDIKINTAAWTLDLKADGNSQMSLDDSRRWGGDALVVVLGSRDSSKKPVKIEKGQKAVYSATLEFRKK
jgi:hypothetical protein